ncbi:MAG TPA: hypothetical protein VN132_14625, partial [Bdellovibrio sp.]|nr:hypothetical protein [Bdellovibrio sp.]
DVDPELIETMKYLPFMVFCVYRQAEGTRLYMCSKELYLASQAGSIAVKPRNIHKATAMVEINNLPVGTQGIIYLNDRSEAVNFRSRTQSGSVLEIETRRNDVDFKDVVEDGSNLLLTASGAEPEDERGVKKISASDWQVLLPKDRPIVYLKGDGDIPMRQEFNIKGPLPQEKFRPYVGKNSVTKTYASNLNLQVNPPKEARLKEDVTDKSGRLESAANGTYRWALTNLPTGEDRRYLKVDAGNQTFTARFDTQRGAPFALALGAHYQTPSGLMFGSLEFQWWFENFLLINSPWSHLHWGFRLEQFQHLNTSSDYAKVDTTTAELLWRAQEGFNMIDASWGLSLPLQMLKSDSHSVTLFGGGIFWQMQPRSLSTFMNWFELKWQYFPISSGSDFKVKSAFDINANAFKKFSEKSNWYLRYGLGFSQYVYDP